MNHCYSVNKYHVGAGLMFLLTGTLIYLFARPPQSALFLLLLKDLTPSLPHYSELLGPLNDVAPSFFHSLGFALLSMSIFPDKHAQAGICLLWFVIESMIELLPLISNILEEGKAVQFLTRGTFDPLDIVAIGFGCLCAFGIGQIPTARK